MDLINIPQVENGFGKNNEDSYRECEHILTFQVPGFNGHVA